jgi:hypothetical protein
MQDGSIGNMFRYTHLGSIWHISLRRYSVFSFIPLYSKSHSCLPTSSAVTAINSGLT